MSKRGAEAQGSREGWFEGDGSNTTLASESQKATAAQLAKRKIAKPTRRGNLISNSRTISSQNANAVQQPLPSPFGNVDPNIVNGVAAQQPGSIFSQTNASSSMNNQSNLQNSFGGFGNASNGFNSRLSAPPKSNFDFSIGGPKIVFPSTPATPTKQQEQQQEIPKGRYDITAPNGFKQYRRYHKDGVTPYIDPLDAAPLWADNAPFLHPGAQPGSSTPAIDSLTGTVDPQLTANNALSSTSSQGPSLLPTSQVFPSSSNQSQQTSSSSVFGNFGQQQPSTQTNIFGFRTTPQPQTQQNNDQTSPNSDIMSTSPDNSPQQLGGSMQNSYTQSQPTLHFGATNSLFGRVTQPEVVAASPAASTRRSVFDSISQPEAASPAFGASNQGGLFGRVTQPEAAAPSPAASSQVSIFDSISKPQAINSIFAASSPGGLFGSATQSKPPVPAFTASASGALFAGFSQPGASTATPAAPTQGGLYNGSTRPEDATAIPGTTGQNSNFFAGISSPSVGQSVFSTSAQSPATMTSFGATGVLANSTPIKERKIAKPAYSMPHIEPEKKAHASPFANIELPSTNAAVPNFTPVPETPQISSTNGQSQEDNAANVGGIANGITPSITSADTNTKARQTMSTNDHSMTMLPPSIPDHFTESQRQEYVTGYRIRSLDSGFKQYIKDASDLSEDAMDFYKEKKQQILGAKGQPLLIPGIKRKSCDAGVVENDAAPQKRVNINGPVTNGDGAKRPLFDHQPPSSKRKADENIGRDSVDGTSTSPKKARGNDTVSYPPLPSTQGSQTSHIFASIVNGTENMQPESASKSAKIDIAGPASSVPGPSMALFSSIAQKQDTSQSMQPPTAAVPSIFFGAKSGSNDFSKASPAKPSTNLFSGSTTEPPSASTMSSLFPTKSSNGSTNSNPTNTPTFKVSDVGTDNPTPSHTSTSAFKVPNFGSAQSNESMPKVPEFKVPNFGAAASTPTDTSKPSEFKVPNFVAATSTPSNTSKPSEFKVPSFGTFTGASMMAQFGQKAAVDAAAAAVAAKKKRKAEEFDSDEDDPVEWSRKFDEKYDEEERAKRQKLEELANSENLKFVPGEQGRAEGGNMKKHKSTVSDSSLFTPQVLKHPSRGTFGLSDDTSRVLSGRDASPTPSHSGAEGSKTGDADDEEASSGEDGDLEDYRDEEHTAEEDRVEEEGAEQHDAEDESPEEDGAKNNEGDDSQNDEDDDAEPQSAQVSQQPESSGRSLFERIQKDKEGNPVREMPLPEEPKATFSKSNKFASTYASQVNILGTSGGTSDWSKWLRKENITSQQIAHKGSSQASPSKEISNPFGQLPSSQIPSSIFGNISGGKQANNLFGQTSASQNVSSPSKDSTKLFGEPSSSADTITSVNQATSNFSDGPFGGVSSPDSVSAAAGISTSPAGDNTWKQGSPIKFTGFGAAPTVSITAASPTKSTMPDKAATPTPLGGLFGAAKPSAPETPSKSSSGLFGSTAATTSPVGFNFGAPPKSTTSLLAAPSGANSVTTSRASSPGLTTDGGSATESTAEAGDEVVEKHEQINLLDKAPGEEDEDVLFQIRTKVSVPGLKKKETEDEPDQMAWTSKGVGPLRVLKHRDTNKTRIVLRADPSGRIILNAALMKAIKYETQGNKPMVKIAVATDDGKLETQMLQVKTKEDALKLASFLEDNKSN